MATHRHHRAGFVLATATALLLGGSVPAAQAAAPAAAKPRVTGAISSHTLSVAQQRVVIRRAAQTADARQRATSRLAAVRTAATAAASTSARSAKPTLAAVVAPVVAPVLEAVAPVTAPVLSDSPSGEAAPVGDLPGWNQTYVENFGADVATGAWPGSYTNHWYAYDDGIKDTSKNGTYMPSKVLSVHDGVLDYSIRTVAGQHLVSAPVLKDTYGQVYGRYSVRFRSDVLAGYKTAWLLWPDTQRWPDDGEIDFPEGNLDGTINAFAHHASAAGTQEQFGSGAKFTDWHTATIEWLPGKVTFALDGKVMGSSTKDVPATAMHWVLQTETALDGGAPAAGTAGHVLVDWVALWTRA